MSLSFPVSPSVGQNFQQWSWDGTKWVPATGTKQSGSRVLLSTANVTSAVSTVDFFTGFDGTYDEMELVIYDLLPSASALFQMLCSVDGSTFNTGATNYFWGGTYNSTGTSSSGAANAAYITFSQAIGLGAGGMPCYLKLRMRVPNAAPGSNNGFALHWDGVWWNTSGWFGLVGAGNFILGPVKGIRFLMASGTINRATFKLYGIVK